VKDPACRVAPERDGPSRKRRPSPSSGTATRTPAHPRRPPSVEDHRAQFAAQRPNRKRHPCTARRRRTSCARACGPAGVRRGERHECLRVSTKTPHPQERAARDRVRPWKIPHILQRASRAALPPLRQRSSPAGRDAAGGSVKRSRADGMRNRARCGLARRRHPSFAVMASPRPAGKNES